MNTDELTNKLAAELEAAKEEGYRQGWEEGFNYALSIFNRPISMSDDEVRDKITVVDTFLLKLKW